MLREKYNFDFNNFEFSFPGKLRFPELCDYGADLSWREGFAGGVVAGLLEFVPEGCAAANPRHEVVDGCARVAVGEVQEGKLLLGVRFVVHYYED